MNIYVDSNNFFCGICDQSIDPVESEKRSKKSILNDSVFKSKINEYNRLTALRSKQKNVNGKLVEEIKNLKQECDNIIKSHISNNVSYLNPAPVNKSVVGIDMSEKDVIDFLANKDKNQKIKLKNGSLVYVDDFTSCVFFAKENNIWAEKKVKNIGNKPDSEWINKNDLSASQIEEIRLQKMTDDDKLKIKENEAFNNFLMRIFKESPEYADLKNG